MPIVTIQITREGTTPGQNAALIQGATDLLRNVLGKPPFDLYGYPGSGPRGLGRGWPARDRAPVPDRGWVNRVAGRPRPAERPRLERTASGTESDRRFRS
jgi:hypothetical protein